VPPSDDSATSVVVNGSKQQPDPMEVELVPVTMLHLDPANARKGNPAMIADSLTEFDQHRPVVAQRGTGRVIIGNHTLKAAQALGWSHINVHWVDDDDTKATRRGIADNATGDQATWDKDALALQVQAVGPVPGLSDRELKDLEERLKPTEEEEPTFPIVPRVGEKYSYVVIVADNDVDDAWLQTVFELRRERDYSNENEISTSRVVTVGRAREGLGI
jgi:hypothetical protein